MKNLTKVLMVMLLAPLASAQGQYVGEPRWTAIGEVGGMFGGRWVEGTPGPDVSSRTGAGLSLGVQRQAPSGYAAGVSVRVSSQALRLRELESQWDGGTLTGVQLLGTVAIPLDHGVHRRVDVELGAGVTTTSGAQTLYPFSQMPRVLPTVEGGLVVFRSRQNDGERPVRPLGLFVRYGVMRVDAPLAPLDAADARGTTAGFVGRFSAGLRVQR